MYRWMNAMVFITWGISFVHSKKALRITNICNDFKSSQNGKIVILPTAGNLGICDSCQQKDKGNGSTREEKTD